GRLGSLAARPRVRAGDRVLETKAAGGMKCGRGEARTVAFDINSDIHLPLRGERKHRRRFVPRTPCTNGAPFALLRNGAWCVRFPIGQGTSFRRDFSSAEKGFAPRRQVGACRSRTGTVRNRENRDPPSGRGVPLREALGWRRPARTVTHEPLSPSRSVALASD